MTHAQAMDEFGSDKPDRRFEMRLIDLAEIFRESSFKMFRGALDAGGAVKAVNAKAFASLTIGQSDELTAMAKQYGAKGLAFIKVENGEWKSPIVKFFTEAEKEALRSKLLVEEGDLILFAADKWEVVCEVLGRVRSRIAEMQQLTANSEQLDFLWVTDFPLLAFDAAENKWNAVHHPFTRPKAEDVAKLETGDFGHVRAEAYDVVLNGVELGGGSIRIHEPDLQAKAFAALGISEADQQSLFGHILRAFRLGAPPHGGIAFGLDRIVMMICREESIREVIAFPKNNRGLDLMSQSPSDVDPRQLRELGIKLTSEQKSGQD
jgi:aspartyl-tRNA synthetase